MKRKRRSKAPSFDMGTARQLIKVVHGLRGSEHDVTHMRLVGNDSTLMDMDAPICIPTGAMRAFLGVDRQLLFVSEDCFLRDDPEYAQRAEPA